MNRGVVARLFLKRTGIKYQNWIQAWAVTKMQKQYRGNTADYLRKRSYFEKRDNK